MPYRLFPFCMSDTLALPDARFHTIGGVPHDIRPQFGCAFLQQQHDRRAAVLEITLLLPRAKRPCVCTLQMRPTSIAPTSTCTAYPNERVRSGVTAREFSL